MIASTGIEGASISIAGSVSVTGCKEYPISIYFKKI